MSSPANAPGNQDILRPGMEGPDVARLQDELISLGYMTLEQKNTRPGRFGPITEKAVRNFQTDNELTEHGSYDLPTRATIDQLNEGVHLGSKGGVVLPMQKRLVKTGNLKQEDLDTGLGRFGQFTHEALVSFQQNNQLQPTGDLTKDTYRVLYKIALTETVQPSGDNVAVTVNLPEQGQGFRTFLREGGATQFGTQKTIEALMSLADDWFQIHPQTPLQYGHISRKGGGPFFSAVNPGTLAHETHKDGRTVDIRPIRKDNVMVGTEVTASEYDHARTKELVLLIRKRHPGVDIILNDHDFNVAGLTRFFKGHFDHLHVHLPK